ncbi:MAG TPA: MBL fold metallo-hydrolase [Candidatus Paceibacterota bacterium]|nr:MBL fold metallo-hydrolase [Candidatus Paceibacterota bacterium]HMO82705.1 MBL fold metallo-hydrolase [Candidatus Paceibacterota bacterium]
MKTILGFYGGVGSVTGANFMLDTGNLAILVDCGLVQGDRFAMAKNAEPFVYNPASVDVLLVTHAHADHIGRIPKLVKDGFAGVIYGTTATKELSQTMLYDALKVMEHEAERYGQAPLYEAKDIATALNQWKTVEYEEKFSLGDDITVWYTDAGHILGSGMIHLVRGDKKIVFTGDIGNVPQPLLRAPVVPKDYDYLVMESVYGDRLHEEVAERTALLRQYIEETQKKHGTLIIPAFSLERTQALLFEINNLIESGKITSLPVFLDSPLAINVTSIYRGFTRYLRPEVQQQIASGDDIFDFDGLKFTSTTSESQAIKGEKRAKIIIAGSGMSHGGRIRRHEREYLDNPTTTLLLVGYQSVGSVGRLLQDGAKSIKIDGEKIKVRAKVARIQGYSGHADRDQLLELVANGSNKAKQIFVTMGEERSSLFLTQRLRDYLGLNAIAPEQNQEVEIDF